MALPRRGSRQLIVGGEPYRYVVSRRAAWTEWKPPWGGPFRFRAIPLRIEANEGGHSRLSALVPTYDRAKAAVTPALVRRLIEHARAAGWRPSARGDVTLGVDEIREAFRIRKAERLASVLAACPTVHRATLQSMLDAGEHLVFFECLLDQLFEGGAPLSRDTLVELRALSHELGVSELERRWVDERLATVPR